MAFRISDIPPAERPRERLGALGPRALSDAELLAILIGSGTAGSNAVETAQRVLSSAALSALLRMGPGELRRLPGIGPARACLLAACAEIVRRAEGEVRNRPRASSPEEIAALVGPRLRGLPREVFAGVYLNGRGSVLKVEILAEGTADAVLLHPREVFRPALAEGATGVVLAHNHPSGDPAPSPEDREVTLRLAEAGRVLGIPIVDHVVVAGAEFTSLRAGGFLGALPGGAGSTSGTRPASPAPAPRESIGFAGRSGRAPPSRRP